jgi:hypothetical protein
MKKFLPKSIATTKGHLRGQQQNIQSTKVTLPAIPLATSLDLAPSSEPSNPRTMDSFCNLLEMRDTRIFERSYSDQTGRFPVQSNRGNNYVFIFYDYDSNVILSEPLPDRRGSSIRDAWQRIFTKLQVNGYAPQLHLLDNECSTNIKDAFRKHNVDFQRVPAHQHRRNAAERAIQTWKNHFIAGLASTDPSFPLSAWDYLLPQCDLTLNLLRSSRRQPKLSAYACLFGNFDFNRTPLAVPGTKVVIHQTPAQRRTFAVHGLDGFYIGHSPEHYRCYKILVTSTHTTRDCASIEWFPTTIPYPRVTSEVYLRQTADDLLTLLQDRPSTNAFPSLSYGSPTTNAYVEIAKLLKRTIAPTQSEPPPPVAILPNVPDPPVVTALAPDPAPLQVSHDAPASPLQAPSGAPASASGPPVPPHVLTPPSAKYRVSPQSPVTPRVPTPRVPNPRMQTPRVLAHDFDPPSPPSPSSSSPLSTPLASLKSAPEYPAKGALGTPSLSRASPPIATKIPPTTRRYPLRKRVPTNRYGFAVTYLASSMIQEKYQHHIAALTSSTDLIPEKVKLPPLSKLLKGEDALIWNYSNSNEFGRLLPRTSVNRAHPVNVSKALARCSPFGNHKFQRDGVLLMPGLSRTSVRRKPNRIEYASPLAVINWNSQVILVHPPHPSSTPRFISTAPSPMPRKGLAT